MDSSIAFRDYLEYVIGQLIDQPEEATIVHSFNEEEGRHHFQVNLAQEDVGKIIGKNGHTIGAIRSLLEAGSMKAEEKASVSVSGHGEEDE